MSCSPLTPPTTSAGRSRSHRREASDASTSSSGVPPSPSVDLNITSSQQRTPFGSLELQELGPMEAAWASGENIDGGIPAGLSPNGDDVDFPNVRPPLPLLPPGLPVGETRSDSPIVPNAGMSTANHTVVHLKKKTASTGTLMPQVLSHRNSLESEMNVDPEDQEALARALELLSRSPQPSKLNRPNRHLTLRTLTLKNLDLPEMTKRVLYALVTSAFTPAQLPAARKIQRFIHDNPNSPIPLFLVTKEIAEISGMYGWCLIGKCGLERTSYKLRSTSTINVMDEVEKNQPRIELLCRHIRDQHFKPMPFQCHLCPASYMTQYRLNRHWRTHQLGEFACPVCGDIPINDVSLQRHHHSRHTKVTITSKFLRMLARAVPLK